MGFYIWKNTEVFTADQATANNDDNRTGEYVMYRTENWQELIVTIAGEIKVHDSRDSWLLRAARKAQISHWHASALFYGKMKDPKWSIGIKVKNAADKARSEAATLSSQYQQIVRGSINVNQNLLGETALEVLDTARLLGGCDLPGDHGIDIVKK